VRINDYDLCAVRTVGNNLSARIVTALRRGKTKVDRFLGHTFPQTRTTIPPLPYDIVDTIIAHLTHDRRTLTACSLTCRSWYIAAYTLTLTERRPGTDHNLLKPLWRLQELGLIPLVREIRVDQKRFMPPWFMPQAFHHSDLRYFSAFASVQVLKLRNFDIRPFIQCVERYFGYFAPTLRSIALYNPRCTPRDLPHMFPKRGRR